MMTLIKDDGKNGEDYIHGFKYSSVVSKDFISKSPCPKYCKQSKYNGVQTLSAEVLRHGSPGHRSDNKANHEE